MTSERHRPAFDTDERTQLLGWFDLQRRIVALKCESLSDADAHRLVINSSPLMTVAGLLGHLRWTEHMWFQVAFAGGDPSTNPQFAEEDDLDFVADGRSLAELLQEYLDECRDSDAVIAAADLSDLGRCELFPSGHASLRWMMIHMVEETARHAGHLDLIRELLDGQRSYY